MAKTLGWIFGPIALLGAAFAGAWYFYPLELNAIQQSIELRRGGVTEFESAGVHGYLRDHCAAQPGKPCACVALIHGLGDEALTWRKYLLLPDRTWPEPVRLYAFDLPGSGESQPPPSADGYRVRKLAEQLKPAMATLCRDWLVVGHSLGGWIATWLALDWREGVRKLVLVDSAGLKRDASLPPKPTGLLDNPTVESLKEFQRKAYYRPRPLPERIWRAVAKRARNSNAGAVMRAQTDEDYLDARLPSLQVPTLLFWGEADQLTPITEGKRMQALIRGAIWRQASECGHNAHKECSTPLIQAISGMITFGVM